ncbi:MULTISPECIES: muconate cycloisomerase family protein [Burkholderiaceae]|jgi:muconate cycloisomerase/chloromuconate cycloisomerase|uniref:Muconate cycloisomerase n=8 Tax=Burkholderiaceae TaxID=119060 RepID=I3RYK5_RALPI|nr:MULTISPECIES: muconate/chloromuconate family cycloisomerase [Burkholderiaceae]AFR43900.1 chloromuconate cycloisomerase [uncultured bacterium]CDS90607.1 Chloromuconate cycloisomerase [Cupriavidus sp. STW8_1]CDS90656.1 Chloromuconate cycloisomerase [Cupriavidus sp. TGCL-2]CDS90801.1 Chloromuconate cycloisomerase [Cupriavidus sp. TGCL-3]CDS90897.1 Chloromuconate cycloisomerase [Cupriavidus sp. STW8_7]CDS90915.1 Chloromuconate cycloisomerase [Cupriavidus sp. STW8_10]
MLTEKAIADSPNGGDADRKAAQIEAIETVIVDLPLRRIQQFARLGAKHQSSVLIRLHTKGGIVGIGESITPCGPWWSGDSVEAIQATINHYLAPLVVGEPALDASRIMAKLHGRVAGNAFAKAGIEMALLDAVGKIVDAPIHVLLGGRFRDRLSVAWPLATGDVNQEVDEAFRMLEAGKAGAFKLKMGALPLAQDLRRALAIAKELEGKASLRVDPNEAWDEPTTMRALAPLEAAGVEIIEQPVARWNLDAMARIHRQARSMLLIDEGVQSLHDASEVVKRAAAGLVSLKIMKTGGMRPARAMADIANAGGMHVYMGTFLETSIGTAANMQLAASIESLPYGGEVIGPLLIEEDLCEVPAVYKEHALWLPEGPGLGIRLDENQVRRFARASSQRIDRHSA